MVKVDEAGPRGTRRFWKHLISSGIDTVSELMILTQALWLKQAALVEQVANGSAAVLGQGHACDHRSYQIC